MNPFQPESASVDPKHSGAAGGSGAADGKHLVEQQLKPTHEHAQLAWESLAYPGPGEGQASK